jgi:hypothetical protein
MTADLYAIKYVQLVAILVQLLVMKATAPHAKFSSLELVRVAENLPRKFFVDRPLFSVISFAIQTLPVVAIYALILVVVPILIPPLSRIQLGIQASRRQL